MTPIEEWVRHTKMLEDKIKALEALIDRLDALNDNPACFNPNVDAAIQEWKNDRR